MKDLSGQVFGDLTVLHPTLKRKFSCVVWACQCVCGALVEESSNKLQTGEKKSCGCRKTRVTTALNIARTKHGHAKTRAPSPTYRCWRSMITRCEDPAHRQFRHYGGRGIKVDPRWRNSFETFLQDMGERPEGRTLDRKDPNLDYSPDNCRWATDEEQASNRRSNVYLTFNGETLTVSAWARKLGCKVSALRMRLSKGWSVERTLTDPVQPQRPRAFVNPIPLAERKARAEFKQRYRHLEGDLTYDQWKAILEKHDHRCAYCSTDQSITMDHVEPLSKGGPHTASNVVPACRSCNSSKRASKRPKIQTSQDPQGF